MSMLILENNRILLITGPGFTKVNSQKTDHFQVLSLRMIHSLLKLAYKEAQGNFLRLSKMLVARPQAYGF